MVRAVTKEGLTTQRLISTYIIVSLTLVLRKVESLRLYRFAQSKLQN
jgi:hypothetical protein